MSERKVGFAIKITQARETTDTTKALDKQRKTLIEMPKQAEQFGKVLKLNLKGVRKEVEQTESSTRSLGRSLVDGFKGAAVSVDHFMSRLDKIRSKVLNVKNVIAASAVGGIGIYLGREILRKGMEQAANVGRVKREFGSDSGYILELGEKIGRRAGIEGDDAARALVPLAEQLQAIQAGSQFRGMKKPLTEQQAEALRRKNLNFGGELLGRASILAPEVDSAELGKVLADALSGPEGVRALISTMNLSKRARTLSTLNEQGKAFQGLSPEERKRLGVSKGGQYLEQGDLVNLLLERSGLTGKEAETKRKGFAGQVRALKATFTDALGDVGVAAVNALNKKLGEGTSLADKLHGYLDKNKGTIEKLGEGLATGAKALADFAMYLPRIGAFLSDHKTLLLAMGTGYLGLKGLAGIGGLIGKVPGTGIVGKAADALNAMPVRVVNFPPGFGFGGGPGGGAGKGMGWLGKVGAVVAAATGGYAVGTAIDEATGLSDYLSRASTDRFEKENNTAADAALKKRVDSIRSNNRAGRYAAIDQEQVFGPGDAPGIKEFLARTQENRDQVFGPGDSPGIAQFRQQDVNANITLSLDGYMLAQLLIPHITRDINNKSARGAAPAVPER